MKWLTFILLVLSFPALAAEKDYQDAWCPTVNGKPTTLRDRLTGEVVGYVDCLTPTHAVEVDPGKKWAEGLGQALFYASRTGRRAGVLLITPAGSRHHRRLQAIIEHYGLPVDVWTIDP
ncbi:MAG TPA: hypothetical protein ENK35_04425 [Candidatus Tenderia sp.]|nr:hypothetical protein [Candidatus Tenderia sp.]